MQLKIVKEEFEKEIMSVEEINFQFFKNIIKKDLELANWCNSAVQVFGEFQIFSDHRVELNSFDQVIIFITKNFNVLVDDSYESLISNYCSDHFFNSLIKKDCKLTSQELETLSETITRYIVDSVAKLQEGKIESREVIKKHTLSYFMA